MLSSATLAQRIVRLPAGERARAVELLRQLRAPRDAAPGTRPPPVDFLAYLEQVTPAWSWDWPYLQHVQAQLARVTSGEVNRLMLFVPPRHGKSQMTTVRYPMYRLERDPTLRIIVGAYNQTLAEKFSRQARRIARARIPLSDERTAAGEWETAAGGGLRAAGVGAGVTGMGGDLLIIDDPVKSREEAESEAYRDRVWEWYTDDLFTRREPGAAIILIMTRWHEDDLAGRILASDDGPRWTVVSLPALAETNDPLGRAPGAALCPDRYDEAALAEIRAVLKGYAFEALYQQQPSPRTGEMFDPSWFTIVDAAPAAAERVRWWDFAATEGDGDYTAGAKVSRAPDGTYYLESIVRGQWAPGRRDRTVRQTAELDGAGVAQWGEQEPGSAGKSQALAFVQLLDGFTARTLPSTGDKIVRAGPFASQAQVGNVKLVRGPWNAAFLEELRQFPRGKHDDQVDAAAAALNVLARARERRTLPPSVVHSAYR